MKQEFDFLDEVEKVQKDVEGLKEIRKIESNLIQQYVPIKEEYLGYFLFFQVGDFFELYSNDAEESSKLLNLHLTSRTIGGVEISMCGFPAKAGEEHAQNLAKMGHKVVIVKQNKDENDEVTRSVNRVITPATITDDKYLESDEHSYMMSAYYMKNEIGIAIIDTMSGDVITRTCHKFAILDIISRYQPKEVSIYITKDLETEFLQKLTSKREVEVYKLPYFYDEMKSVIDVHKESHFKESFVPYSVIAAHYFLLERLNVVQKEHVTIRPFSYLEERDYMYLHKTAVQGLELFENNETRRKEKSLFDLLNRCTTPKGSRVLREWIQEPLLSVNDINKRYNMVEYFLEDSQLRSMVQTILSSSTDVERIITRLETGKAKDNELCSLLDTMEVYELALNTVTERTTSEQFKTIVQKQLDGTTAILVELRKKIDKNSVIAQGYDIRYDTVKVAKENGLDRMKEYIETLKEKTGVKTLKLEHNKVLGYHFEVTKSNYDKISDEFIIKKELSNKKQCITEELVALENKYLEALEEFDGLYRIVLRQLITSIKSLFERIRNITDFVAKVDVFMGYAEIAEKYNYQRPIFTDNGIYIKNAKHPLLQAFGYRPVVANNCFLQDEAVHIITGPNMGGKTVYEKTVALMTIMAQIGCFVPGEMKYKPVDRILVRIGATDSLLSNQSTFMMEMEDMAYILLHATQDSLIIIDELGRGTSTNDGLSIAHSIIEEIHDNIKAKTLCSTHFHELSNAEKLLTRVKNIHAESVEIEDGIKLTYRIVPGIGSKSFGIHVAKLAGIPSHVVNRSEEWLKKYEDSYLKKIQ